MCDRVRAYTQNVGRSPRMVRFRRTTRILRGTVCKRNPRHNRWHDSCIWPTGWWGLFFFTTLQASCAMHFFTLLKLVGAKRGARKTIRRLHYLHQVERLEERTMLSLPASPVTQFPVGTTVSGITDGGGTAYFSANQ